MLSQEALIASTPLASLLDQRKLHLVPIQGTPLEALVAASRVQTTLPGSDYVIDPALTATVANAKDAATGICDHDPVMDDIVHVAANAVREHIAFAKSVVAPSVQDLVEKTLQTLAEPVSGGTLGMEVIVKELAAPLAQPQLEKEIRRFDETPFDSPALQMRCPDLSAQAVAELMQVGQPSVDEAIAQWLETKGEGFVQCVWECVFQVKVLETSDTNVRTFSTYVNDRDQGADYALAIFLIARKLVETTLDGVEMTLVQYQDLAASYRDQAAMRLVSVLNDYDRTNRNGMLVASTSNQTVTVNGAVYQNWIADGGENEVLFGMLLSGEPVFAVDQINAQAETLKAAWSRYATLQQVVERNRRYDRTKAALARHFASQLAGMAEEERALVGDAHRVGSRFGELLEEVRENELDDLYSLALRLVCEARFSHTDARTILAGIERVKRENPSVDVREAAAISVIEYVATWASKQFRVVAV